MRIPEVNGTDALPAASIDASRTAGSLSGEPKCAPPGSHKRDEVDSSINPMDGAAARRLR